MVDHACFFYADAFSYFVPRNGSQQYEYMHSVLLPIVHE